MKGIEDEMVEGRCRICGASTSILRITEFNLKTCRSCYPRFFERRVRRTLEKYDMLQEGDRVVVAVSGGKDSSALLYALRRLGVVMDFEVLGLHFHLDMGDYSDRNLALVEKQAGKLGIPLEVAYIADFGLRIQRVKGWQPCAVCGAIKRALLNREARRMGATVMATAHTMDDVLLFTFKNLLSHKYYIPQPVLPPLDGMTRKIKPLMFTPERFNSIYCHLRQISYFDEKCPEWSPRAHALKDVFVHMEEIIPSSNLQLLLSLMEALPPEDEYTWNPQSRCPRCGELTNQDMCTICQLKDWYATTGEGKKPEIPRLDGVENP
jgi:tRNA(Ile)-lysidine synthase TilS/MesJ